MDFNEIFAEAQFIERRFGLIEKNLACFVANYESYLHDKEKLLFWRLEFGELF